MIASTRRLRLRLSVLAACAMAPVAGLAQDASAWATGLHSRVQLVSAGAAADAPARLAGLVIRLDPGFKTYWRHPGESGLPPAFDWSKSTNVAAVEVLWPAPTRLEDAGGVSYGYHDGVVLPLRVTPREAGEPMRLALTVDYGVCKDICIPARADVALKLPQAGGRERPELREALLRVPTPHPLGAAGDLSILRLEPLAIGGKPMIAVAVRAPDGPPPKLFAEGPDPWFLSVAGDMTRASGTDLPQGATGSFLIEIAERPKDATGPLDLRLTLVAGDRAIETAASLDSGRLSR